MNKKNRLICGDALVVLQKLPDNSIDSIVTDPPAGIGFMESKDRKWDSDKGGRDMWIQWLTLVMREALRVLKPGGHALVWSIPRASHWTATALEDAGFEIRDKVAHLFGASTLVNTFLASLDDGQRLVLEQILESREPGVFMQIFGQGFPKSTNISKQLDKQAGAKREVVSTHRTKDIRRNVTQDMAEGRGNQGKFAAGTGSTRYMEYAVTAPATPEAQQWDGWGTNLKPAYENWILVRKPLAAKTVAKNVLQYGTGGLNIGETKIGSEQTTTTIKDLSQAHGNQFGKPGITYPTTGHKLNPPGRFPSHLLLSHSDACVKRGTKRVRGNGGVRPDRPIHTKTRKGLIFGEYGENVGNAYNEEDGMETVEAYECAPDCPIAELDKQNGAQPSRYFQSFPTEDSDLGDYTPFLYQPKASGREKSANGTVENTHNTVKSITLMRWLIKLVTPPDGTVLDCFAGSGSTLVAAIQENKTFIGIEREREYCTIAQARIKHALQAKRAMIDTPVEGKAG